MTKQTDIDLNKTATLTNWLGKRDYFTDDLENVFGNYEIAVAAAKTKAVKELAYCLMSYHEQANMDANDNELSAHDRQAATTEAKRIKTEIDRLTIIRDYPDS